MLKLDDFKKIAKSQVLNDRFITGGGTATTYTGGEDMWYDWKCVT